jgi:uncharacterized protein DUF4412
MRTLAALSFAAVFSPAGDPDTVLTTKVHTDAFTMRGRETPARDATQTVWIRGKDRMRFEDGERVVIVRLDEKKLYVLDPKEKSVSAVDLPFDAKKYLPEDGPFAERVEQMMAAKVTVTPSDETKRIGSWSARRFAVARSGAAGSSTSTVWTSTEVGVDSAAALEMVTAVQSLQPGEGIPGDERKKIEGFPVLAETTRSMGETEIKSRKELVSVERKEAPAGAFDVPADYEKKPFELRMMGGARAGRPGGREGRGPGGESRPASRTGDGG